jgi:ATP-dependent RNA helicase DDX10/DBP4
MWRKEDGLGALVITPSRELAIQIFDVLRLIGQNHHFSAGLLVGGAKNFKTEQEHIGQMTILIATPGRLLQHLEQTYNFSVDNLQVLVLDEADQLLEHGIIII